MSHGSKDYPADAWQWNYRNYRSDDCDLVVRQNPSRARAAGFKEKGITKRSSHFASILPLLGFFLYEVLITILTCSSFS